MSSDTPRRRIDWNGEWNEQGIRHILKPRLLMRKAAAPAAIGLVGLALVGALAIGPLTRSMMTSDPTETAAVKTASIVPATSEAADTPSVIEAAVGDESDDGRTAPGNATAARMAGAEAPGLAANDPRWSEDALSVDEDKLAELKKAIDETVAAVEIANAMEASGADGLLTSTIPAQAAGFAPERPSIATHERSAFDAALSGASSEAEPEPASNLQPAKANQYVNMRAAPSDDANVLAVVPANASIEAETDCRWCEVSYDGRKGYIFQSFIAR